MNDEYYLLGFWSNAYRAGDREYFWSGPFDSRTEALAAGKRRQEYGQPKTFIDWVKGGNKSFSSRELLVKAANKVGMNPAFRD
jgi:hypothetical protein